MADVVLTLVDQDHFAEEIPIRDELESVQDKIQPPLDEVCLVLLQLSSQFLDVAPLHRLNQTIQMVQSGNRQ